MVEKKKVQKGGSIKSIYKSAVNALSSADKYLKQIKPLTFIDNTIGKNTRSAILNNVPVIGSYANKGFDYGKKQLGYKKPKRKVQKK